MADQPRHPRADLTGGIASQDFFALLRSLETETQRFGRAGGAAREPARLGQTARMSFATSDVAALRRRAGGPPEIGVNVLGLIGPEGPLPLHITRWILQRLSNRWFSGDAGASADTSFLDFVNILQHRQIALYWRAWADARADIHVAHGDGGRVTATMRALAGLGLPGVASGDAWLDGAMLHHATSLAQDARSPERLTRFLETVLGLPVRLIEFVGVWLDIPGDLQTRLGVAHAGLGTGLVAGGRVFDRQSRAELRIGPLTLAQFEDFIDDADMWTRLRHAVRFAAGEDVAFDVRPVLAAGQVPAARLGQARLGRTAWLGPKPGQGADDLVFARATDSDRVAA